MDTLTEILMSSSLRRYPYLLTLNTKVIHAPLVFIFVSTHSCTCGGDFPLHMIRRSITHHKQGRQWVK